MNTAEQMDHISSALVRLHAARWVPVLHQWLSQYRGLHDVIHTDSDTPESQILAVLGQMDTLNDGDLAQRLSRLDFLTWRARLGQTPWKPLEVSFNAFWTSDAKIWQSDREFPASDETQAWLLEKLRAL